MIVAAQPAARRRPGGGDVASGSTAPYVIEGWRQVIVLDTFYENFMPMSRSAFNRCLICPDRKFGLSTFMELSHGRFPVRRRQAGSQRFSVPFWSADRPTGPKSRA